MPSFKSLFSSSKKVEAVEDLSRTENKQEQINSSLYEEMFPSGLYQRMFSTVQEFDMNLLADTLAGAQAGQIGNLSEFYINIEESDSRLSGMINSRRSAVTKASFTLSAPENLPNKDEILSFIEKNIESLKWKLILKNIMDGKLHGSAVFEKVWHKAPDGRIWLDKVVPSNLQSVRMDVDSSSMNDVDKFGQIYLDSIYLTPERFNLAKGTGNGRLYVNDIDPRKVITAVNTNRKGYYDIAGIMRPVGRWYVLKTFASRSWAQYAETFGFPIPTVEVDEQYFKKNKNLIKTLLQSVGVNRFGIFFPGMKYDLHKQADQASISVFENLIQQANTEMAIAILGQNLTSEVNGGSQAAARTHFSVMENLVEDDLDWLDEIINDQIIPDMVSLNFPNVATQDYPKYTSIMKKSIDLQKFALGVKSMSGIVPIPTEWIYKESQIPAPNENQETVGGLNTDPMLQAIDRRFS